MGAARMTQSQLVNNPNPARSGMMLSRVADTLYWLSRYLERAEHSARLIDLQLHLMLDQSPQTAENRWERLLYALYIKPPAELPSDGLSIANYITFHADQTNGISACIAAARENARHVRELISTEMWEQINRLSFRVKAAAIDPSWHDQPHEFYHEVKEGIHLFQGITDSTMSHGEGWQFIQIGRALERIGASANLLKLYYAELPASVFRTSASHDFLDWIGLLKSCTAFESYCKVYTADFRPDCIAEFLILNPHFPHAIRFAVSELYTALHAIEQLTDSKRGRGANRLVGRLRSLLEYGQIDEIVSGGLSAYLDEIQAQCSQIHEALYHAYISYPIEEMVS